jgi:ABC-type thiamine transport system ATPase subunit
MMLITGASGAGTSTVRELVARELSPAVECIELRDVAVLPAVPTIAWRQQAAEAAVQRAVELQRDERHLVLAATPPSVHL